MLKSHDNRHCGGWKNARKSKIMCETLTQSQQKILWMKSENCENSLNYQFIGIECKIESFLNSLKLKFYF